MYHVRVDYIAEDIPEKVRREILEFLKSYEFPYVTSFYDKVALKEVFIQYFNEQRAFGHFFARFEPIA